VKGQRLLILLVEDNLDHAELIRRSLQSHPMVNTIYHVRDGEAALDYLFRHEDAARADPQKSPQPHIILLDLRLPKIDGLEVLRKIKSSQKLRFIPVVVLTTSRAEGDLSRAYEHHANSYLVKPVNFDMFTQLMDDLGFYWLRWNRQPQS